MLEHLGVDAAHVHSATMHEVVYQAVMRLSLRQTNETHPVRIVVPDSPTAERIAQLLGVKEIKRIGDLDLKGHKPLSATERNRRSKTKKLAEELFAPKQLHSSYR